MTQVFKMLKIRIDKMSNHLKNTSIVLRIFVLFFSILGLYHEAFSLDHPHMIVQKQDFSSMEEKQKEWPWSVMKEKAITTAKSMNYNSTWTLDKKCTRIHEMASAIALAFILDQESRSVYINKVESQIAEGIHSIRLLKGTGTDHGYNVAPAHAAFMVYLLLDIMYDDLSLDVRQSMEDDCDYIASNHVHSWFASEYSIKGMMELYHNGNTVSFKAWKDLYKNHILDLTSSDGVYSAGPGYSKSRLFMDNRMQKKIFMDICEYQGYNEFFNNPKLQLLYEWVMGYLVTPFNRSYTFGDTPPTKDLDYWTVAALRVQKFSENAASYALWRMGPLDDDNIIGGLLHFLLCDSLPVQPTRPRSKIFDNGGAWLREDSESKYSLAAVLWNINTIKDSHRHFDINAIHIAGYGAHILRNSGYDGSGMPDPVTWDWIKYTAESSNTLMMNDKNHAMIQGGGIDEGLIGGNFEYACGNSGSVLPLGTHHRNMIFVRPVNDKVNGYFIFIDQLRTIFQWDANALVNIAWHPNSFHSPDVTENNNRFSWQIDGCDYGGEGVGVSIHTVTPTIDWEIRDGYLASYSDCSRFTGKYLYNSYQCSNNLADIMTIIFPFDVNHTVAQMKSLEINGGEGCEISHDDSIIDYALVSRDSSVCFESVSFAGTGVVWRENNGSLSNLLAIKSTEFFDNDSEIGFKCDSEISIQLDGNTGKLISKGGDITFFQRGIEQIKSDGMALPVLASGDNWMTVAVDSGQHDIVLEIAPTHVDDLTIMTSTSNELLQNYPNPFNNSTVISFSIETPEFVDLSIFNINGQLVNQLVKAYKTAGSYRVKWDAQGLSRGIYFVRITTGEFKQVKKIILQ